MYTMESKNDEKLYTLYTLRQSYELNVFSDIKAMHKDLIDTKYENARVRTLNHELEKQIALYHYPIYKSKHKKCSPHKK